MLGIAVRKNRILYSIAKLILIAFVARMIIAIVVDYRDYFPANFNSSFLLGRNDYFFGWYSVAFYVHIIAGPIAVFLSILLLTSSHWKNLKLHRRLGKIQFSLVIFGIVPTGLAMSVRSYTGPIAGVGFALQSIATGLAIMLTVYFARKHDPASHRAWANRCLVLLVSPLFLRVTSSVTAFTEIESPLTYQLSAWLSWIVPLTIYEFFKNRVVSNASASSETSDRLKGELYAYSK